MRTENPMGCSVIHEKRVRTLRNDEAQAYVGCLRSVAHRLSTRFGRKLTVKKKEAKMLGREYFALALRCAATNLPR